MEYQDYYAILGVSKTADEKQIRSAYRKLARKHHPDVNPGDNEAEDRFKAINEAYEVLSDPEKRKKYDQLGAQWKEYEQWERAQKAAGQQARPEDFAWARGGGPAGARYEYRTVSEEDLRDLFGEEDPFSDFFGTFFGRERAGAGTRRAQPRARTGQDIEQPIEITLEEAYRGTTRVLSFEMADGKTRRIEAKIPPGVDNGSRVRLAGQGIPGGTSGGPAGDLYLVVSVRPDPRFERRGDHLFHRLNVPLTTLLLGGETRVGTLDGRSLALTIPQGTQDGRVFVLRGQGMPRLGRANQRGDLHVEVHARLPKSLSPRQRELLEELARLEGSPEGVAAG
jgi:DnaJ-class molecular chaperone